MMNFIPFPRITTERLFLRKLEPTDNHTILFLRSDEVVNQFIQRKKTNGLQDANDFIARITNSIENNEVLYWAVTLKTSGEMIGTFCLWNFSKDKKVAEIGYDSNPNYQKQGFMNEALKSVLAIGFNQLNLERIEAFTHKDNKASICLLEKNNFKLNPIRKDDDNLNNLIFEISTSKKIINC